MSTLFAELWVVATHVAWTRDSSRPCGGFFFSRGRKNLLIMSVSDVQSESSEKLVTFTITPRVHVVAPTEQKMMLFVEFRRQVQQVQVLYS